MSYRESLELIVIVLSIAKASLIRDASNIYNKLKRFIATSCRRGKGSTDPPTWEAFRAGRGDERKYYLRGASSNYGDDSPQPKDRLRLSYEVS
mgnify:CR=1 FL=1